MADMQLRFLRLFVLAATITVMIGQPLARSILTLQLTNDGREVASERLSWIGETLPVDDLKDRVSELCGEQTGDVAPNLLPNSPLHRLAIPIRGVTKTSRIYELQRVLLI